MLINFKLKYNLDKIISIGSIAQLGERLVRIEKVTDSNSARSTTLKPKFWYKISGLFYFKIKELLYIPPQFKINAKNIYINDTSIPKTLFFFDFWE